jgi:penicillin-binding protein 1C
MHGIWRRLRPWQRRVVKGTLWMTATGLLALVVGWVWVYAVPFPVEELDPARFSSVRVLDRHGVLMREWLTSGHGGRSQWRKLDEVSPWLRKALLAAEDARFYDHSGVDARAVGRAVRDNLSAGRVVSGASTITMQVVRLLWPGERSLRKKASEAVWALRLERAMTKDQILEQYINRAPFGNQLYGVEAAALRYFGKTSQELSPAQAAFLAGLPQSPIHHNPLKDITKAQQRQRWILGRMRDLGDLTDDQYSQALGEPLLLQPARGAFAAPHFMDYLYAQLPAQTLAQAVTIETTLDHQVQALAEGVVSTHIATLRERNVTQAAVVVLDVATAEVLAMVGSRDFFDAASEGQVNGAVALRQPGSSLKPFTYALALERGWTAGTLMPDIPITYKTATGTYAPGNFDNIFRGPVRARPALACSLNIPAIKAQEFIGVQALLTWLRRAGFSHLTQDAEFYGLALTLGAGEVRLLDLAAAYGVFARGGLWRAPTLTRRVTSTNGPLDTPPPETRRLLDPSTAYIIADILSDPMARAPVFGMHGPLNLPFWVAAKTGTSSDFRDIWTVGFSDRYIVAVWVGNFDGQAMNAISGITGAAPIFRDIMLNLHPPAQPQPPSPAAPPNLTRARICTLSGALATPRCPSQRLEWFSLGRDRSATASADTGAENDLAPGDLGAAPTETCDMHREVLIFEGDGLLVPQDCAARHPHPEALTTQTLAYLPPAYDSWLLSTGQPLPPTAISPTCRGLTAQALTPPTSAAGAAQGVRILRPAHQSTFQLDPALPRAQQQVRLEANAPSEAAQVRWLVDGEVVGASARPFRVHWPLREGIHTVTAVGLDATQQPLSQHQITVEVLP